MSYHFTGTIRFISTDIAAPIPVHNIPITNINSCSPNDLSIPPNQKSIICINLVNTILKGNCSKSFQFLCFPFITNCTTIKTQIAITSYLKKNIAKIGKAHKRKNHHACQINHPTVKLRISHAFFCSSSLKFVWFFHLLIYTPITTLAIGYPTKTLAITDATIIMLP